jgi:hypothetical protein
VDYIEPSDSKEKIKRWYNSIIKPFLAIVREIIRILDLEPPEPALILPVLHPVNIIPLLPVTSLPSSPKIPSLLLATGGRLQDIIF